MDYGEYIRKEAHRLYWEHDTNCARTTIHCLGELFQIKIEEQTWNAAVGMHGAGGFRAQCGLVEGGLMFLGIYCAKTGFSREETVKMCYRYAEEFQKEFGGLRCQELRPSGFSRNDPPHMCEDLTCKTIVFSYEFIKMQTEDLRQN